MTRYGHIPWLLVLMVGLFACQPDDPVVPDPPPPPPPPTTGTLRVTLIPEWGGQPFAPYTEYRNFMDYRVTVEMLKLYFGDACLVEGMDTLLVKDVDLFDLGNGAVSKSWTVAPGTWTKLRAALGVPARLNYADPATYGPGHPLSVSNGTYWTWATGYRYVLLEGRYDTDPSGTGAPMNPYAIHPGMEPSYIEFELVPAAQIVVTAGNTTEIRVRVAVDRFFHSSDHTIDLATENSAHGSNQPLQWKLVNNVVSSMTVE